MDSTRLDRESSARLETGQTRAVTPDGKQRSTDTNTNTRPRVETAAMGSDLGLSCPYGGDFYICQGAKIEFVGCCTSNPCSDGSGSCIKEKLRPSSFSMTQYAKIPSLGCDDSQPRPELKPPLWYTCIAPTPPFMGCCFSNPCGDGCPQVNVSAARLPDEATTRQMFLTNANVSQDTQSSNKLSGGAIAGIVVGAIAVIVALAGAYWFMRRKKQRKTAGEPVPLSSADMQHSEYTGSSIPNYSPHPCKNGTLYSSTSDTPLTQDLTAAVSPHSGFGYPNTPPQGHGFQNGYHNGYQPAPSELGNPYVAELSGNHQGEVAMLDSTPVGHHQAHSPTIPLSESTVTSGHLWPVDKK